MKKTVLVLCLLAVALFFGLPLAKQTFVLPWHSGASTGQVPRVLSQDEVEQITARNAGGYIGIGMSIEPAVLIKQGVTIKEVQPDSTAEAAGVKAGDLLISVDGTGIQDYSLGEVGSLIAGEEGTKVRLGVTRGGKYQELTVERDLDNRIGIEMEAAQAQNVFAVSSVFEKGPAETAGVAKGDIIQSVDGKSVDGMKSEDLIEKLRTGRLYSRVELEVSRGHKPVKVTVVRQIVPSWSDVFAEETQTLGGPDGLDPRGSWGHISLKNLDWVDVLKRTDFSIEDALGLPGIILDLRHSSGNDPDAAARIAARFVQNGVVLRLVEGNDTTEVDTKYEVVNGELIRTETGARGGITILDKPEKHFNQKVVVLVDEETSGTAAALALALQANKVATVVGGTTSGNAVLTGVYTTVKPQGDVSVLEERGRLVTLDGKPFHGVSPDTRVWIRSNLFDAAKSELAGDPWYYNPNAVGPLAIAIVAVIGLIVMFRSARKAKNSPPAARTSQAPKQDETPKKEAAALRGKTSKWSALLPLVGMFALIALMVVGSWWLQKPPAGVRSLITVEFYTDGSVESARQAKVIDELAHEYTGAIKFVTIDVRQHPDVLKQYRGEEFGRIQSVPCVRISKDWYDKDGKSIAGGWQGFGKLPKRELVRFIESNAQPDRKYWPATPIHRNRPQVP